MLSAPRESHYGVACSMPAAVCPQHRPVAWATNDGLHPRYLPEEVNLIYLPLAPLARVEWINQAFYYYTAVLWGGFPAGYTTL